MDRIHVIIHTSLLLIAGLSGTTFAQSARGEIVAPPEFAVVAVVGDELEIVRVIERQVVRTVAVKPTAVGRLFGVIEPSERREVVKVVEELTHRAGLEHIVVRRVDGTKLNAEEIREALKKPVSVVMSKDDARIGAAYSKVLNPKSLVVTNTTPVVVVAP